MKFNINAAKFVREVKRVDQAPKPPRPAVVFAGRSNVGKSTLINSLVGHKNLAKTSRTPGRTQSIVYFEVDEKSYFIDVPGYGFAKAPERVRAKWGPMVENFLTNAEEIRLVIIILDIRREPSPDDLQLVEWLETIGLPYFFVLTKVDKVSKGKLQGRVQSIGRRLGVEGSEALLPFSAVSGQGRRELIDVIRTAIGQ